MPQMAPMNWAMLMIYFIMIFISYNLLNYFIFEYSVKTFMFKKSKSSVNWKW
uniref:ATP synthase complex subunit 8 n=1 Tax=Histeridae sp. BMNH 1274329 TaxID=1796506 RepID=A0A140EGG5_9COLE|nr:ATP synthase F0 subunit 8 [Histeridae sp. BMNH 1274329]